jgi:hypothetical protein
MKITRPLQIVRLKIYRSVNEDKYYLKLNRKKKLEIYDGADTTFSDGHTFKRAREALNRELL